MKAAEKRVFLQTILGSQALAETLRAQLQSVSGAVGAGPAADLDALLLKVGGILDEALQAVAIAPVDVEKRTAEQLAADAKAGLP